MCIKERLNELFNSIDTMNTDKFVSFLSDDCIFTFGNMPPAVGKEAIYNVVDNFFKSISKLEHHSLQYIQEGNYVVARGLSKYIRHNGTILEVGFCNVFELQNHLIKEYRIYIDLSQLYN